MNKGLLAGFTCYLLWGFFPLYWKLLSAVPAVEILAHRIFWSLLFLVVVLTIGHKWSNIVAAINDQRTLRTLTAASLLLSINWGVFIWAVNNNFIVEASLGYFINPLVNVLFGVIIFGERLRRWQTVSIALALSGVLYLTWAYGRPPWIALILAFSFGLYGVLKKRTKLAAAESLGLETALVFPIAVVYLFYLQLADTAAMFNGGIEITLLLTLTGIATAVPLMLFAYGAQHVSLTTLGIMQYTTPSIQFLLGVFVYNEPFDRQQLVGFVLIWLALLFYSAESIHNYRLINAQKFNPAVFP